MGAVVSRAALPPTTKEPTKHDLPPSSIIPQASEQDSASLSAVECRETDREVRSPSPVEMVLGTGADPTLLQIILQYLPPEKALHVASVSHLFAVAAASDDVWLVFCERLWEEDWYRREPIRQDAEAKLPQSCYELIMEFRGRGN